MTTAVDALLDVRITLSDAHVIATERCVGLKGKELVKANGIVAGLDWAVCLVDLSLEAVTSE